MNGAQGEAGLLLFGIGNSGRGDDGLGWAFLDLVAPLLPGARAEYRYQLQVEDAALAAGAERIVFIDGCHEPLPGGFEWCRCEAAERFEFSTHELSPQTVLHLCDSLYGRRPPAELLLIQGRRWTLGAGLSRSAKHALHSAVACFSGRARDH